MKLGKPIYEPTGEQWYDLLVLAFIPQPDIALLELCDISTLVPVRTWLYRTWLYMLRQGST